MAMRKVKVGRIALLGSIAAVVLATTVMAQDSLFPRIGNILINIFSFEWLNNDRTKIAALVRGGLWFMILAIIMSLGKAASGVRKSMIIGTGFSGFMIAAVLATLGTVLIPVEFLYPLLLGYASLISMALALLPFFIWYWFNYQYIPKPPLNITNVKMQFLIALITGLPVLSIITAVSSIGLYQWLT